MMHQSRSLAQIHHDLSVLERTRVHSRTTARTGTSRDPAYDRAEIWRARAKSLAVSPPAEWVLRVSVTLFHWMVMSG
jgi:hypothetical protein